MKTLYFVSYLFKQRWGNWGAGSMCVEIAEPITEKNFDIVVDSLKKLLKVKGLVILNFKELLKEGGEG